jgi:hypothetical protein
MMLEVHTLSGRSSMTRQELDQLASDGIVKAGELLPPDPIATHATFESVSGDYRASIPLELARAKGRIRLEEDTLRLRVEEGDTLCWNVKGLERIRYTVGKEPDSVPENPPH